VAWPYSKDLIPAGWARDTTLDTYFIKSIPDAVTAPGATGGAANHTHTASNDGHTQTNSHTHSTNGNTEAASGTFSNKAAGSVGNLDAHVHAIPNSGAVTASAIAAGGTTITATSNNPPYREVIWIYNADGSTEIPNHAIAFFASAGDIRLAGTRPPLACFIEGRPRPAIPMPVRREAIATTHTSDHNHSQSAASAHTSAATDQASADSASSGGTGSEISASTHTHSVTYDNSSWTTSSDSANVQNINTLPPFIGLVAAQMKPGSGATPDKVVAIWRQSIDSAGKLGALRQRPDLQY